MLKQLYIKNYALIDLLEIDLQKGFSVITGETGAGKSIILGAIGMLLGQRADIKAIKNAGQKCAIEAHFDISRYNMQEWFDRQELDLDVPADCIIRREVSPAGKSRGFINDTPVTLAQMKELGEMLIDVHSQHQNLLLQKENFQLSVVDIIAQNENERNVYAAAYNAYKIADEELLTLRRQLEANRLNEDFMRFQLDELGAAGLQEGEQETLEQEQQEASHSEEIKDALFSANNTLSADGGVLDNLNTVYANIKNAASMTPKFEPLEERVESLTIELKDVAQEIANEAENVDYDPERLDYINSRLNMIYTLEKKHKASTIEQLIAERNRLQTAIDNIDNSDMAISEKEKAVEDALEKVKIAAETLTKTRQKASRMVEEDVKRRLASLGMPNVTFSIRLTTGTPGNDGQDRLAMLFSANKGMTPRPVAEVASGGEIARLMLSLKAMISGAVKLPTIIFDEIDTGVSGKVAEKMADIMYEMGQMERQVISITHLPQIAAKGSVHYKVEKHDTENGTVSMMRKLSPEERVTEIAQMMSGEEISEAAMNNARTLLNV